MLLHPSATPICITYRYQVAVCRFGYNEKQAAAWWYIVRVSMYLDRAGGAHGPTRDASSVCEKVMHETHKYLWIHTPLSHTCLMQLLPPCT